MQTGRLIVRSCRRKDTCVRMPRRPLGQRADLHHAELVRSAVQRGVGARCFGVHIVHFGQSTATPHAQRRVASANATLAAVVGKLDVNEWTQELKKTPRLVTSVGLTCHDILADAKRYSEHVRGRCQHAVPFQFVVRWELPGKHRLVVVCLDQQLLQPEERFAALSVQHRHGDAEETQQRVSHVFLSGGCAPCGPRHDAGNADESQVAAAEHKLVDARDVGEQGERVRLGGDLVPMVIEKDHVLWSNQLLQRPAAQKPAALVERHDAVRAAGAVPRRRQEADASADVVEVHIANGGLAIVGIHGIDGLRQLCGRGFVDADRVDPEIVDVVLQGLLACPIDLEPALAPGYGTGLALAQRFFGMADDRKGQFSGLPRMGEDCIARYILHKVNDLLREAIEKLHRWKGLVVLR
ncbi:uncharacterized protein SPSK_06286 [Sporothrix schenckii 1099-18]|uniref:Uncharacterized protein n=1 Tax=Sporothrix schenckii 1099-18 TaxID=1397361 RepID=A0A0F2MI75_SPOSC|nr:uncharacterized protein SPSK_06286 [Sporothrix schenckii 1099-18]KJR89332.1 hypothetical protein SPSK_06286 [Sporothrix schenckii 1099-18]